VFVNGREKGSSSEKTLYCSFCGKSQHEVKKLIAGPSVFICDECIDLCNDIIREEVPEGAAEGQPKTTCPRPPRSSPTSTTTSSARSAKRTLAVAVYNHYKRLKHKRQEGRRRRAGKSNILLIGPTGSARRCWRRRWRASSTCPS
jgi:ATP-dependent Clp protease ATP-binding subunit ClpX